jgi:hypothetical protein
MKTFNWDRIIIENYDLEKNRLCVLSPIVTNSYKNKTSNIKKIVHCKHPVYQRKWFEILGMLSDDPAGDVWTQIVAESTGTFKMLPEVKIHSRRYKDSKDKSMKDETLDYIDKNRRAYKKSHPFKSRTEKSIKLAIKKIKKYLKD